jgi:branched-chain amino acid transport system permease protein
MDEAALAGRADATRSLSAMKSRMGRREATILEGAGWLGLLAILTALPMLVDESYLYLSTDFLIMSLFAMSYNLLFGKAGMLSFGHAAFFGLGAYTVALLYAKLSVPTIWGILCAPVVASAGALVVGFFAVRLSGMSFGIFTMAFAQLIYTVIYSWYDFTGGDNGLPVTPPDYLLPVVNYYYFALAVVALCILLIRVISSSVFGAAIAAIRENPQRAECVGINVRGYQIATFVIAGAFAGVAGGLRASQLELAVPSLLYWTASGDPVLISLVGGFHTFVGPIVGAAIFVFLNFLASSYIDYPLFAFGLLVLAVVMVFPKGCVGTIEALVRRRPWQS